MYNYRHEKHHIHIKNIENYVTTASLEARETAHEIKNPTVQYADKRK